MKPDVILIPGFLTCGEADALLGRINPLPLPSIVPRRPNGAAASVR
jgi:hypothetical protein